MTCMAPRGKPYEKKKDPYEGRTCQVMGRNVGSFRQKKFKNTTVINYDEMVIEWVRSYLLTSSQLFSRPALHLGQ